MGFYKNVRKKRKIMDKIIVLDFGSQYSHLICRRIRESNVYCELLPYNTPIKTIMDLNPKGIILSGGPASVYEANSPKPDKKIFELNIPLLGICYGHQIIVDHYKGKIKRVNNREYGNAVLKIKDKNTLFKNIQTDNIQCWMSHSDAAEILPFGFENLAETNNSSSAAIGNTEKKIFGIQFHPEVVHTQNGFDILNNFSHIISEAKSEWTMNNFIESIIENIKSKIGNEKVLCAVSGGIDSTTAAILIHRAIGENLTCVFVNNGLLRQNEEFHVRELFDEYLGIPVEYIDAQKRFLNKLKGVSEPENKRKLIGAEFAKILTVPKKLLKRHPFPGPGLAVRILGELTDEKIKITKKASKIVEDVLVEDKIYDKVWQAYAMVGDDKAVGILGDERIYGHIVTVRIVESLDAMTADWVRVPYPTLEKISSKITN